MTRGRQALLAVGVAVLTFAIYLPARHAERVHDSAIVQAASPILWPPHRRWTPAVLSAAEDRWRPSSLTETDVSVGLHLLVVFAVWGLLGRFVSAPAAVVGASVFAVHPLQVESVAYYASRAELLAALGVVTAALAASSPRFWVRLLTPACLVLGVLSKETAVVAFVLVPACVWANRARAKTADEVVSLVALVGLSALLVFEAHALSVSWVTLDTTNQMTHLQWAAVQAVAALRLLVLAVIPIGQTVDYDYDAISWVWRLASFVVISGLSGVAVYRAARRRPFWLPMLWIAVCVWPRLIVQTTFSYMNEHQFYLAMVGVAMFVAEAVDARRVS